MTTAAVRGGLLTAMETLAGEQASTHEVSLLSPSAPRLALPWRRWGASGNADVRAHLRLLRLIRGSGADTVMLHAGSPGELSLAAALLARRRTTVVVEHAPEHYPLRSAWRTPALAVLKRRAHAIVSVSAAGAAALETAWHLPAGTVAVVENGVGAPGPSARTAAAAAGAGPLTVLAMGAPSALKGFGTFGEVAGALSPRHPAVRWLWAGGGQPGRRGPVEILPWQDDIGGLLGTAGLLMLPSLAEGMPLTLLEAWACGVPVAASRVGGVGEVVRDGLDGVLVAAGDTPAWVEAVGSLLEDGPRRRRLGEAGHSRWREAFTAEAMCRRYERLLARLWAGREEPR